MILQFMHWEGFPISTTNDEDVTTYWVCQIIQYLIQKIRSNISDFEIFQIFKNNKHVLLLLLEEEFIRPDEKIISEIKNTKDKNNFEIVFRGEKSPSANLQVICIYF